jgi:hypothetical protein
MLFAAPTPLWILPERGSVATLGYVFQKRFRTLSNNWRNDDNVPEHGK